jgi:hypothetical protein
VYRGIERGNIGGGDREVLLFYKSMRQGWLYDGGGGRGFGFNVRNKGVLKIERVANQ